MKILFIILIPLFVISQTITNVSGTLSNKGEVTITGTSFGTKSTAYPLISSYDNATTANNFSSGSISSSWYTQETDDDPVLTSVGTRTNLTQSSYKISYDASGSYSVIGYNYANRSNVVYVSWWMYKDYEHIAETTGSGNNAKYMRLYTSSGDGNGLIMSQEAVSDVDGSYKYTYIAPEYAPDCDGWSLDYTATNTLVSATGYFKAHWLEESENQNWNHYELYNIYSTNLEGGEDRTIILKNGQTVIDATGVSLQKSDSNDDQRNLRLGQVSGGRTETQMEYIDQIYYDNTVAHVFIADASNLTSFIHDSSKYHSEIQVCSSWSDTSIKFTLNQGTFSIGDTAYIYVVDASGDISNGEQFIFNGSDEASPTGILRISNTSIKVTDLSSDTDSSWVVFSTTRWDTSSSTVYTGNEDINQSIITSYGNKYYAYWKAKDDSNNVTYFSENEDSVLVRSQGTLKHIFKIIGFE